MHKSQLTAVSTLAASSLLICVAISVASCSGHPSHKMEDDVVYAYKDTVLHVSDVVARIPEGLTEEDSAAMFAAISRAWLEDMLLADVAEENLADSEEIDRLTAQYRRRLIIEEYKRRMRLSHNASSRVTPAKVKEYYTQNAADLKLHGPIIKGLYIKVPNDASQLADVKKWVFNASKQSIDRLEKYGLRGAMQYEYFADKWVDFSLISDQIPHRFGDTDAFVKNTVNFETADDESVYLLHIYSYKNSGEPMPEEYAQSVITEMLERQEARDYDDKLLKTFYNRAIKEGKLSLGKWGNKP